MLSDEELRVILVTAMAVVNRALPVDYSDNRRREDGMAMRAVAFRAVLDLKLAPAPVFEA